MVSEQKINRMVSEGLYIFKMYKNRQKFILLYFTVLLYFDLIMTGFGSVKYFLQSIKKVLNSSVHVGFILCMQNININKLYIYVYIFNLEVKYDPVISCQGLWESLQCVKNH